MKTDADNTKVMNNVDPENPAQMLLLWILYSSSIVFEDLWLNYKMRKGKTFELIILSVMFILRKLKKAFPQFYNAIREDLFDHMYKFALHEQITGMLSEDYLDFVGARLKLYEEEFSGNAPEDTEMPVHTAFNLFIHPLLKNSGICEDQLLLKNVKKKSLHSINRSSFIQNLKF